MKKLIATAAAIALLTPALASAQDRGDPGGRFGGQGGQSGQGRQFQGGGDRGQGFQGGDRGGFRGGRGGDPSAQPAPVQAAPAAPAQAAPQGRFDRGGRSQNFQSGQPGQTFQPRQRDAQTDRRFDNRGGDNRGGQAFDNRGGQRFDQNRGGQADRRFDNNNGRFDNNNRRYDDRGSYARRGGGAFTYRGNSYARFRADPYRWPGGYRGGLSWRPRQILPSTFLLRDYYIDNYYDFGFQRPPYGYEWIRVGDDALLVNTYTGEIVEVTPGVFYW